MSASNRLDFTLQAQDPWSGARAARFSTRHGVVETPIFMPVATQAALRGVDLPVVDGLGFEILLANTYHLLLRPGPALFKRVGGIHNFMNWPRAVLTDSGGYQIFSLARQLELSEEGACFRSYVDGRQVLLTPELSIETQTAIGSDIMMVLDHCIDSTSDKAATVKAMQLTARWAKRSFEARSDQNQALFGIVQGACFEDLRRESAQQICEIAFDGFAIGGLAVGETKSVREDMVEFTAPLLPKNKPRYLMGVGTPIDLLEAVKRGLDMFDCILPTSLAHQGVCFSSGGKIDLRRGVYRNSDEALDPNCGCATCKRYSRSYLHHLVRADEFVADQLLGIHNLTFYRGLMKAIRESIIEGSFESYYRSQKEILQVMDLENPSNPPKRRPKAAPACLGDYQIREHEDGYGSIEQISSGEVMHPAREPQKEALELYVRQAGICEIASSEGEPLTIWDVGLGAATNAMSCLLELEKLPELKRAVQILSFERDLDALRLASSNAGLFKHLQHRAPYRLINQGKWEDPERGLSWQLFKGEFMDLLLDVPAADIIWYDPFSYKVDRELWSVAAFEKLLAACAAKETTLYTYSASTAVRSAMLAAGWFVGKGAASAQKSETTVAFTPAAASKLMPQTLLGEEWYMRWTRSDAKHLEGENQALIFERLRNHSQFSAARIAL